MGILPVRRSGNAHSKDSKARDRHRVSRFDTNRAETTTITSQRRRRAKREEHSRLVLSRRPPKLTGFRGHVIHWDGCAKYADYLLRSAYADTSAGFILVVTHSDWGFDAEGYDYECNPGDGFIVIRIDSLDHGAK